jgi:hypothetical protein
VNAIFMQEWVFLHLYYRFEQRTPGRHSCSTCHIFSLASVRLISWKLYTIHFNNMVSPPYTTCNRITEKLLLCISKSHPLAKTKCNTYMLHLKKIAIKGNTPTITLIFIITIHKGTNSSKYWRNSTEVQKPKSIKFEMFT